jgi:hypothetical protein
VEREAHAIPSGLDAPSGDLLAGLRVEDVDPQGRAAAGVVSKREIVVAGVVAAENANLSKFGDQATACSGSFWLTTTADHMTVSGPVSVRVIWRERVLPVTKLCSLKRHGLPTVLPLAGLKA